MNKNIFYCKIDSQVPGEKLVVGFPLDRILKVIQYAPNKLCVLLEDLNEQSVEKQRMTKGNKVENYRVKETIQTMFYLDEVDSVRLMALSSIDDEILSLEITNERDPAAKVENKQKATELA